MRLKFNELLFSNNNISLFQYQYKHRVIDVTKHKTKIIALSILVGFLTPFTLGVSIYFTLHLLTARYKWKKIQKMEKRLEAIVRPLCPLEKSGGLMNAGNTCYIAATLQSLKKLSFFMECLNDKAYCITQKEDETDDTFAKRLEIRHALAAILNASSRGETISAEAMHHFRLLLRSFDSEISETGPGDAIKVWQILHHVLELPCISYCCIKTNRLIEKDSDHINLPPEHLQAHLFQQKVVQPSRIFMLNRAVPILTFINLNPYSNVVVGLVPSIKVPVNQAGNLAEYRLVSMLGGLKHSTAYVKNEQDQSWVLFDDEDVLKLEEPSEACRKNAVVLFYQLVEE